MPGSTAAFLRFLLVLFAALSLAGEVSAATFGGKRVALVIGNGKYPTAPLRNPVNDARAMAKTLKELGFEVTLRENASQRDMAAAVRQFGSSISPGTAALFYFAGHGMQVKGRNYLVPTDADIQLEDEVPYAAIDVNLVLDKMEVGKSAINLVILDACRNNPFARRFRSSGTGLAQMDAPVGTLIAFATAPGSVAQDGAGENGIYTKHLLESIAMPGLPVEQMFKRVRVGVARETNEAQIPWESSSMKGDFVFREAPPQPALSQDKLIEEAARAAAERAAALTAERMQREQAARAPQQDRARAELDSLNAERENLLRERERLAAENEALRRKAVQAPAPVALAAPTTVNSPSAGAAETPGGTLKVGDSWNYRYSDGYGKAQEYAIKVTAVSATEVTDELRSGRARQTTIFTPEIALISRSLGGLQLREFAPYLLSHGPGTASPEGQKTKIFEDSDPFTVRWVGTETVAVPAGTFQAKKLLIEGKQAVKPLGGTTILPDRIFSIQVWYAPEVKRFVKMSIVAPEAGFYSGRIGAESDTIELLGTGFPPAPSAATQAPIAAKDRPIAPVASLAPIGSIAGDAKLRPKAGDSWTYRYSDKIFGKSETYTVRVTSASAEEIADEARIGKTRHSAAFDGELALTDRKLGGVSLREISPYLMNLGTMKGAIEQKTLSVFNNSNPFTVSSAGTETVQVPAGQFEAHKLVLAGNEPHPLYSTITRGYTITVWYAPKAKRFVKLRFHGIPGMNMTEEEQTIEMLEYRLQ